MGAGHNKIITKKNTIKYHLSQIIHNIYIKIKTSIRLFSNIIISRF